MSWTKQAACLGMDLDIWFPPAEPVEADKAKRICADCPVRAECLVDALQNNDWEFGIRGGLTAPERFKARREWRRSGLIPQVRLSTAGCGTERAWRRHRKRREECSICDRWRAELEARMEQRKATCGTRHGYTLHKQAGEDACQACMDVERDYQRERHLRRKAERRAA